MLAFTININGKINSRALWNFVKHYEGVNVTDLGNVTYVYGNAKSFDDLIDVICLASMFGDIEYDYEYPTI